ncbi:GntR family transcriptional regulator [Actinoplanes sp. NBRC 101535]|uniref:GntR family transcriptional regulator n=1 Tax=Actinoplanes sp. NBRC 101535 TaxID=3032196 RepID=UPI0024A19915|nr:GntR family transcriptional regulator [Actinoplanes sp. NBRC 101535]GLY07881.1 GntR family transcriptional regulator [Actinoplanes sp. NBRC 101535]
MSQSPQPDGKQMLSGRMYTALREAILRGEFAPGAALKPQELATRHGVSLPIAREALVRLVGDGLADRLTNRGFAVPRQSDERWQQIGETRRIVEPATLRLAIARGDLEWEGRVRAAHHRLARTSFDDPEAWSEVHRLFHRTLLEGSGNAVLLDTFDRLWLASELARRWSGRRNPDRDAAGEHRRIEEATLAHDADLAARLLTEHLTLTTAGLAGS